MRVSPRAVLVIVGLAATIYLGSFAFVRNHLDRNESSNLEPHRAHIEPAVDRLKEPRTSPAAGQPRRAFSAASDSELAADLDDKATYWRGTDERALQGIF